MKVSILIPVYGVERYIAQCAESLFAQTYENIEYIFVDDCSPDNSVKVLLQVLEKYPERKSQVCIIRHEKNSGVGLTRNTAFRAASGDFLMHADSDDYMPTNAVELLVCKQLETKADIIDGGYMMFNDDGFNKRVMPYHATDEVHLKIALCPSLLPGRLWGRLYRRSLMVDNNVNTEFGIDNMEDYSITTRLFLYAKRATLDEITYCYRIATGGEYSNTSQKNIISVLKSYQVVYDHFIENDKNRKFYTALQLGMLNAVRYTRQVNAGSELVAKNFNYRPEGIVFRFCTWALRGGLPFKMADMLYRMIRAMYVFSCKF